MKFDSAVAFVLYAILMWGGYMFSTFFEKAPYLTLATWLTAGFTAFITKRLLQKQEKYNNGKTIGLG